MDGARWLNDDCGDDGGDDADASDDDSDGRVLEWEWLVDEGTN